MTSPEYDEILSSLQKIVRQAYALGRSEALKQVVAVMKSDDTTWKPLAIAGPDTVMPGASRRDTPSPATSERDARQTDTGRTDTGRTPVHSETMEPADLADNTADAAKLPWWQRPTRAARPLIGRELKGRR